MGSISGALEAAAGDKPFLQPLVDELQLKHSMSKAVLAGLVFGTLRANRCGMEPEQEVEVQNILMNGMCTEYEFKVANLAGAWDNDLLDILISYEPQLQFGTFYKEHVWPFLQKNEVLPGIRMPG